MRADDIELPHPCTIDLRERMAGAAAEFHCDQCDRTVHVLSHSTEADAAEILARRQRDNLCVAFLRTPDGRVHFRDASKSLVPASRLAGPRMMLRASALALAVAACSSDSPAERVELDIDAGAPPAWNDEVEPPLVTKPEGTQAELEEGSDASKPAHAQIEEHEMMAFGGAPPAWDRADDQADDEAERFVTFNELELLSSKQEPPRHALSRTKAGRQGGSHLIEISYSVDERGRVVDAKHAGGDQELARVYIKQASRWRFRPYKVDGQATRVRTFQRIVVDLGHDEPV